jgi:hypothetical protein
MIPLLVIVGDKLGDGPSEVALAKQNHPIQASRKLVAG